MACLKTRRSLCWSIALAGLVMTIVVLILLSWIESARPTPPSHYLNINPAKEHAFNELDKAMLRDTRLADSALPRKGLLAKLLRANISDKSANSFLSPLDGKPPANVMASVMPTTEVFAKRIQITGDLGYFKESLARIADSKKNIILSIADSNYIELALNFYELSIKANDITNFALVCVDKTSNMVMIHNKVPCIYLPVSIPDQGQNSTVFGSVAYFAKTNLKTLIMSHCLKLGYDVLLVDLDVILFKSPLPYLMSSAGDYDIQISMDRVHWNSGFVYVKSTNASVRLYRAAWDFYVRYHKSHDQAYLGMALKLMLANRTIRVRELSSKQFPNGYYYFQYDGRFFRNEPRCSECVMAHNNYLGTVQAKIYRFKENMLWAVDTASYFSDPRRRYLTYDNPADFGHGTWSEEVRALYNAFLLAELSQRTVILPTFRCCDCTTQKCSHPKHHCSLMHILDIRAFDSVLEGEYRESVFLQHPKVPTFIRNHTTSLAHLHIDNSDSESRLTGANSLMPHTFRCKGPCNKNSLAMWLRQYDDFSTIKFRSLYGNITTDSGGVKTDEAFKCATYEQWQVKPEL